MEDYVFISLLPVFFLAQLLCCWRCRRVILKLIPLMITLLLILACLVGYALSGWTNWAFLIIILLLGGTLAAVGAAWVIYGVAMLLKKAGK